MRAKRTHQCCAMFMALLSLSACKQDFAVKDSAHLGSDSSTQPLPTPTPLKPTSNSISAGTHQTCALDLDGTAYCWGRASAGQMGDGTLSNKSAANVVSSSLKFKTIRSGTYSTCALSLENEIFCWGQNAHGSLGVGDEVQKNVPIKIATLPDKVRDFGISAPFNKFTEHIVLGIDPRFGCSLLMNGDVYCWGDNRLGTLAQANTLAKSVIPIKVSSVSGVQSISVGAGHVCVIVGSPTKLKCWGDNHAGQLGPAFSGAYSAAPVEIPTPNGVSEVKAGGAFTCLVDDSKHVACWGQNFAGQLGRGTTTTKEVAISPPSAFANVTVRFLSTGLDNACVITTDDKVYCWGDNYCGQFGNNRSGSGTGQSSPYEMLELHGNTLAISVGTFNICSAHGDGSIKCWGHAYFGEAGNGVMYGSNVLRPTAVLGFKWR